MRFGSCACGLAVLFAAHLCMAMRTASTGLTLDDQEASEHQMPFSLMELNDAYRRSLGKSGSKNATLDSFMRMMTYFRPHANFELDMDSLVDDFQRSEALLFEFDVDSLKEDFRRAEVLFGLGGVSDESWAYAWGHLPSVILDYPRLRFVLHSPVEPWYPADGDDDGVYTFSGWETEGGAFLDPEHCGEEGCVVHVNLRDLYTDMDELVSNLLIHILYMEQHPGRTFWRCQDARDSTRSCRHRGRCSLSLGERPHCKGPLVSRDAMPEYAVELRGFNDGPEAILQKLDESWRSWAGRLLETASALAGCGHRALKVHVIQGAALAVWIMTSKYAMQSQPEAELAGSYGGRFEEDDRRYARLFLAAEEDNFLPFYIDAWNEGKHVSVPARGPLSVSAEVISLSSWEAGEVDPVVTKSLLDRSSYGRECAVLINTGYAFGTSALPMGRALKHVFGDSLKSFYVIGKAGGLVGQVGDYQVASSFFLWRALRDKAAERVYTADASEVDLTLWSGGRKPAIHQGGMMTVPSVVLQSHRLLDAAKAAPWRAVGIEMESYWFKRALPDTPGLYLYYTSDIPQAAGSTLAHEHYPRREGQTLFNGLVRMALVHMLQGMSHERRPMWRRAYDWAWDRAAWIGR
mmetsp:Transcript_103353/g.323314  ORF Transcript_103353/g.323314 Transcript_103353/m.323314 type:complete len:633 (+) Transcript_103353:99-1997(+)